MALRTLPLPPVLRRKKEAVQAALRGVTGWSWQVAPAEPQTGSSAQNSPHVITAAVKQVLTVPGLSSWASKPELDLLSHHKPPWGPWWGSGQLQKLPPTCLPFSQHEPDFWRV